MPNALGLSNLLRPDVLADPYPFYQRLRSEDPVRWDSGAWVLTRYTDVASALRDSRLSVARMGWELPDEPAVEREALAGLFRTLSRWMGFVDPPDHTRLRGLVHQAFTPRVIEGLRRHTQELVDHMINTVRERRSMDVIRDVASPLPVIVIAELLGLPVADRDRLKRWSDDLARFVSQFDFSRDELPQLLGSLLELTAYLRQVIMDRRRRPGEDLISTLLNAEETGDVLHDDELLANCVLLLFAGHETTTDLIGNGLLALLRYPDQHARLRRNPALIACAVEEFLRFDCPAQLTVRVARQDVELGGKRIREGESLVLMLGAANHDPAQFVDPDNLDITRPDNAHIAFGYGIHFCLGAALARMEGQIAIGSIIQRLPALRLATESMEWRPTQALRGLRSLPVAW